MNTSGPHGPIESTHVANPGRNAPTSLPPNTSRASAPRPSASRVHCRAARPRSVTFAAAASPTAARRSPSSTGITLAFPPRDEVSGRGILSGHRARGYKGRVPRLPEPRRFHHGGLTVLHDHIPGPLTAIALLVRAGSRFDGANPGIAHMTEHMLFQGTER